MSPSHRGHRRENSESVEDVRTSVKVVIYIVKTAPKRCTVDVGGGVNIISTVISIAFAFAAGPHERRPTLRACTPRTQLTRPSTSTLRSVSLRWRPCARYNNYFFSPLIVHISFPEIYVQVTKPLLPRRRRGWARCTTWRQGVNYTESSTSRGRNISPS